MSGDLYRHKDGDLYREVFRSVAADNCPSGEIVEMRQGSANRPFMATNIIQRGEQVVAYEEVSTGLPWLRPARLFDDGRFVKEAAQMATFEIKRRNPDNTVNTLGTVKASSMGELRDALTAEMKSEAWAFAFQAAFDLGDITIGTITVRRVAL